MLPSLVMRNRQLIDNQDGTFTVPMTRGLTALVDASDAKRVGLYNWSAWVSKKGDTACGVTRMHGKVVKLHRWLMGVSDPKIHVDHRNQNPLDNRRCNLRVATHAENQRNKSARRDSLSGVKGVQLHRQTGKWVARIGVGGVKRHLGLFDTIEEAAEAYAKAARELHGKFARTDNAPAMPKPRPPRKSKTGVKGVKPTKYGRFEAMIRQDGRLRYLGTFDTIEASSAAVRDAERALDAAI